MNMDGSISLDIKELIEVEKKNLEELKQVREMTAASRNMAYSPYMPYSMDPTSALNPAGHSTATTNMLNQAMVESVRFQDSLMQYQSMSPMSHTLLQRDVAAQRIGNRMTNAAVAGAGGIVGVGSEIAAASIMPGLVGGIAGGMFAGIGAGAMFGVGLNQMKQQQGINEFLMQNSHRMINRSETNNMRYGSGFTMDERFEVGEFVREINSDKFLKDDEVQSMLSQFTEYDLMKSVSDVKSFKEKFSKLIDATKESALLLSKSYDEVTAMMGEMNKFGISGEDFNYYAAGAKNVAAHTGRDAGEVMEGAANIARGNVAGTSADYGRELDDVYMAQRAIGDISETAKSQMSNMDLSQAERDRYSAINSAVKNLGGSDAATQFMMGKTQEILMRDETTLLSYMFDADENGRLKKGENYDAGMKLLQEGRLQELADLSSNSLNNDMNKATAWANRQERNRMLWDINGVDRSLMTNGQLDALADMTGLSKQNIMSMQHGMDSGQIALSGSYWDYQTNDLNDLMAAETFIEGLRAKDDASNPGLFGHMKSWLENAKDFIGSGFTNTNHLLDPTKQSFTDWLNGKDYSQYASLGAFDFSAKGREDYINEAMKTFDSSEISGAIDYFSKGYSVSGDYSGMNPLNNSATSSTSFYTNLEEILAGKEGASDVTFNAVNDDLARKIQEAKSAMKGMTNKKDLAEAEKHLATLMTAKDGIETLRHRVIQSGSDSLMVANIFEGVDGHKSASKALKKLIDRQQRSVSGTSLSEFADMEMESTEMLSNFISGLSDEEINDALSSNTSLKRFLSDSEGGWTDKERNRLVNNLKTFVSKGGAKEDYDIDNTVDPSSRVEKTIQKHGESVEKLAEVLEKTLDKETSIFNRFTNNSYVWGSGL